MGDLRPQSRRFRNPLPGEHRFAPKGVILDEVITRDLWELPEWNWLGLRSATSAWNEDGAMIGWISDLALPAKSFWRRLNQEHYQEGQILRAYFVRNVCPLEVGKGSGRAFFSYSWVPIPLGVRTASRF